MAMEEEPRLQEIGHEPLLRRYYGDERRRLFPGAYEGLERRLLDPPTEQDEDREPPPN
jgi:hypothetical protein